MKKTEKEFDLVKVLNDAVKHLEVDSIVASAKKDAINDVVNFIVSKNLKITTEETEETKEN